MVRYFGFLEYKPVIGPVTSPRGDVILLLDVAKQLEPFVCMVPIQSPLGVGIVATCGTARGRGIAGWRS